MAILLEDNDPQSVVVRTIVVTPEPPDGPAEETAPDGTNHHWVNATPLTFTQEVYFQETTDVYPTEYTGPEFQPPQDINGERGAWYTFTSRGNGVGYFQVQGDTVGAWIEFYTRSGNTFQQHRSAVSGSSESIAFFAAPLTEGSTYYLRVACDEPTEQIIYLSGSVPVSTYDINHQVTNAAPLPLNSEGVADFLVDVTRSGFAAPEIPVPQDGVGRAAWYYFDYTGIEKISGKLTVPRGTGYLGFYLFDKNTGVTTRIGERNIMFVGSRYYLRVATSVPSGDILRVQVPAPGLVILPIPPVTVNVALSARPSEPGIKAAPITVRVRLPRPVVVGDADVAEAVPVTVQVKIPAAAAGSPAVAAAIKVGVGIPAPVTSAVQLILTAPDDEEVLPSLRPTFVVGLAQDDEDLTYDVEIQVASDAAFTNPVSYVVASPAEDGGVIVPATQDVPAAGFWRARALLDGTDASGWSEVREFTVDATIGASSIPITWTVGAATRQIHLWHVEPPGAEPGETAVVYGHGFPSTGGVLTLADKTVTVDSWTLIPPTSTPAADRVINGEVVDPEHFEISFTVPDVAEPGGPLVVSAAGQTPTPVVGTAVPDNSVFYTVQAVEPNVNAGWQIRVLDYRDLTTVVAFISEWAAFSISPELSDSGAGSLTLDEDSPFWRQRLPSGASTRAIKDYEYVFEAWENGLRRFAFLGRNVEDTIIGDDETRAVTISGPGIADTLKWAIIQRPGWPKKPPVVGKTPSGLPLPRDTSYSDKVPALLWRFPVKWSTMRMWHTVFKAAQRRGVIPFVKPLFTALRDSAKRPFVYIRTQQNIVDNHGYQPPQLDTNLHDFLQECTGQDYGVWFGQRLEWMMYPGFKLDVRTRIGIDRTKTVRFYEGGVITVSRTRDRENIANRITAVDVEGTESIALSAPSARRWNVREKRDETHKNVTDATLRRSLANIYLERDSQEISEWTVRVPYDSYGRQPFRHYNVGDTIALVTYNGSIANSVTPYRVMAITVSMTAESLVPDVELTLQSRQESRMQALEKQITKLINQPRNFRLDDIKDVRIPEKPKVKSQLVYDPDQQRWVAQAISTTPGTGGGTGGGGTGRVWMQSTDPSLVASNNVKAGDFWLETYD